MPTEKWLWEFYRKWCPAVFPSTKEQGQPQLLCLAPAQPLSAAFRVLWLLALETELPIPSHFHSTVPAHVQSEKQFVQEQCLLPLYISKYLDQQVNEGWGNVLRENAKSRAIMDRSHYSLRCKASGYPCFNATVWKVPCPVYSYIKPCAESKVKSSMFPYGQPTFEYAIYSLVMGH